MSSRPIIAGAVVALLLAGCKTAPPPTDAAPGTRYPFATTVTCGKVLASPPHQIADFGRQKCDKTLERLGGDYTGENRSAGEFGLSGDHCLIHNTGGNWVLADGTSYCFPRMTTSGDIFAAVPTTRRPGDPAPDGSINRKLKPAFFIELTDDRIWIYFPSSFNADMKSDAIVSTPVPTGTPPEYINQYERDTYLPGTDGAWQPNGNEPGASMFYLFGVSTDEANAVVVAFMAFLKGYEGRSK